MDSQGTISLPENPEVTLFLKNLVQPYLDSYCIVLIVLNDLMDRFSGIEQSKLVNEIHVGIQEIFLGKGIRYVSSCTKEILNNSIYRFHQLGACQAQSYCSQ